MKWGLFRLLIILAALWSHGCQPKREQLCKVWFYKRDTGAVSTKQCLMPACFLNLQQDGTYTLYFSQFEYGRWQLHDSVLMLTNQYQHTRKLSIVSLASNHLMLHLAGKAGQDNFEGAGNEFDDELDNPFCIKNNEWRLPPAHKETDAEIAARLRNHFRFWEKYFNWGIHMKQTSLDAHLPPTLFKLHGNGLAVRPADELPDRWVANFYDKEDCNKASDKVNNFFQSDDINWPRTGNKYQLFIAAFRQLQDKIH